MTPFWQPNAWLLKEMKFHTWWKLSHFERFCWIWNYKNRIINQLEGSEYPYLRIKFEDFFYNENPRKNLERLLFFLHRELPGNYNFNQRLETPINLGRKKTLSHWTQWTSEQCQQLYTFCGDIMERYGYGHEPLWKNKIQHITQQKNYE
jgi:hypothetical protein